MRAQDPPDLLDDRQLAALGPHEMEAVEAGDVHALVGDGGEDHAATGVGALGDLGAPLA
jgi:hypothetical protein